MKIIQQVRARFVDAGHQHGELPSAVPAIAPREAGDAGPMFFVGTVAAMVALMAAARSGGLNEDAYILLRYARHLGAGLGLVWNPGGVPTDGATDFLFTLGIAALIRLGLSPVAAAQGLASFGHVLSVVAVYAGSRCLSLQRCATTDSVDSPPVGTSIEALPAGRAAAFCSALFLAFGPARIYIAEGFGTPLFAAGAAIAWYCALRCQESPSDWRRSLHFAVAALVLGLLRPEGVWLGLLMLLAILRFKGLPHSRREIKAFGAVLLSLGSLFLLWRWWYFGHWLPLPFHRKAATGGIYWSSVFSSLTHVARTGFLCLAALAFGWLRGGSPRAAAARPLIPVVGFTLIWGMLSDAQNWAGRFQYPLLPLLLMSWPGALRGVLAPFTLLPELSAPLARKGLGLLAAVGFCWLYWQHAIGTDLRSSELDRLAPLHAAALVLQPYRDKGYVLATTEAGTIPFLSEWRTLDLWGLNDWEITRRGGVAETDLERERPHVIFLEEIQTGNLPERDMHEKWCAMLAVAKHFAETSHYLLAGLYPLSSTSAHFYYVRRDFADSAPIAAALARLDYGSWTRNLASDPRAAKYFQSCSSGG